MKTTAAWDTTDGIGKSWRKVRLRDVCTLAGATMVPMATPETLFAHYSIPAFDTGSGPTVERGSGILSNKMAFPAGCVLFSKLNPRIPRAWFVNDDAAHPRICSAEFLPLLPRDGLISPRYLKHLLYASIFQSQLRGRTAAATKSRERLDPSAVMALEIPLPPLAEQERIAGRLTEQLGAVERARAAAEQRLAAAESLPAALLREVFEGPEASGWETVPLGELCDFKNGLNFRSNSAAGHGVKIIGVGDFQRHLFVPIESLTEAHPAEPLDDEFLVRKDDFVFVRSNGNPDLVGRAMIVPKLDERVTFTGFSIRARPRGHRADPLFLAYYFKSGDFVKRIRGAGRGSNIRNLSQDLLSKLETPLPPLPDQRRIAADLTQRLAAAEGVIARCREELAAIEALPAALLRQAFSQEST